MAPVLAEVFRRVGLVEEVISPLPDTEPVGIVQLALGIDVVVDWAMGIGGDGLACGCETLEHFVGFELLALLFERRGVSALG